MMTERTDIDLSTTFDVNCIETNSNKIRNGKKSRRQHSNSFSCYASNGHPGGINIHVPKVCINKLPLGKNSKKSRNGFPNNHKKAGAGGKGMWGKPEADYINDLELDEKDPDYDSDINNPVKLEEIVPIMEPEKFEDSIIMWTKEYFKQSEHTDFIDNWREINVSREQRSRLIYLCISTALQYKSKQRELTSQLFVHLSIERCISMEDMQNGFYLVLEDLPDTIVDVPEACDIVGRFIARAVADDVLPPKFVQGCKFSQTQQNSNNINGLNNGNGSSMNYEARQALAKAEKLLNVQHAYYRLETIWGVIGIQRPTGILEHEMNMLIEEYLNSADLSEAIRCLRELEAPHFHHELVYQAVLMLLERSTDDVCKRIVSFLSGMWESGIVTSDQVESGIRRIYKQMSDIRLDVPSAYFLLDKFIEQATEIKDECGKSFLSASLVSESPVSYRRRFVSEGGEALRSIRARDT